MSGVEPLGLFLLFAWSQDGTTALAWWGMAYLIGSLSGAMWRLPDVMTPPIPESLPDVLLFIAVGTIWSAARLFHGRPVLWGAVCFGAMVWLASFSFPLFATSAASRLIVSSLILATYTFLTAAELWRERRKSLIRRWPASLVPMLHDAIFLFRWRLRAWTAATTPSPPAGSRSTPSKSCSTWSAPHSSC